MTMVQLSLLGEAAGEGCEWEGCNEPRIKRSRYCTRHRRDSRLCAVAGCALERYSYMPSHRYCWGHASGPLVQCKFAGCTTKRREWLFGFCEDHAHDTRDGAPVTFECDYCGGTATLRRRLVMNRTLPHVRLCPRCQPRIGGMTERWAQHHVPVERQQAWLREGVTCWWCGGVVPLHAQQRGASTYAVDHDHRCCPGPRSECGQCVRGTVHAGCNLAIGQVEKLVCALDRAEVYRRIDVLLGGAP